MHGSGLLVLIYLQTLMSWTLIKFWFSFYTSISSIESFLIWIHILKAHVCLYIPYKHVSHSKCLDTLITMQLCTIAIVKETLSNGCMIDSYYCQIFWQTIVRSHIFILSDSVGMLALLYLAVITHFFLLRSCNLKWLCISHSFMHFWYFYCGTFFIFPIKCSHQGTNHCLCINAGLVCVCLDWDKA